MIAVVERASNQLLPRSSNLRLVNFFVSRQAPRTDDANNLFWSSTITVQTSCLTVAMPGTKHAVRLLSRSKVLPCFCGARPHSVRTVRSLSSSPVFHNEASVKSDTSTFNLDPALVTSPSAEKAFMKTSTVPIGSRRRRAALQSSQNLPFEQLPYQCFQEARKVLQEEREEKLEQIKVERARIARLQAQDMTGKGEEAQKQKQTRLRSMQTYLEKLKILADVNDPVIKKRFEDGQGMTSSRTS